MKIKTYESLPDCAKEIRKAVFIDEQGFQDEFDAIDDTAAHLVMFHENGMPIATCRIFWNPDFNLYILGRLAVMKEYRGQNIGTAMIKEAEKYVQTTGRKGIALHAQCRVTGFYKKLGFIEFGKIEDEQGCPHIWMKKIFN